MELAFTRSLYEVPGPYTSVYLDATHDTAEDRAAIRIRWKNLRSSLTAQGADERDLHSLDAELADARTMRALDTSPLESSPHRGRHGIALFAAQGEVRYGEILGEPPHDDIAEVSPLPSLTPMLALRGERVAWLRVIVDRVGADISPDPYVTIRADGTNLFPIRKTHGGGWSEEHLHRKAESRWQHNAQEVAVAVTRLADEIGAELIVVAGDVHGRRLLIDELPERWLGRVVDVEGGSRARGADRGAVDRVTDVAVANAVAQRRAAAVDRFTVRRGEFAVTGVAAVADAFGRGQVGTLLLDPATAPRTELVIAPEEPFVTGTESELKRRGVRGIQRVPAHEALIRAAAATDADLLLVSADDIALDAGVGAVLRYADPGPQ